MKAFALSEYVNLGNFVMYSYFDNPDLPVRYRMIGGEQLRSLSFWLGEEGEDFF